MKVHIPFLMKNYISAVGPAYDQFSERRLSETLAHAEVVMLDKVLEDMFRKSEVVRW